jgi:cytochrome c-type biogenesis protein CcmE
MTARQRRMGLVALLLVAAGGAVAFALQAFRENMLYFVTPSELLADAARTTKAFRLGGMVKQGSVHRVPGSLDITFVVTDTKQDLPVTYRGVLPDLFREGQGVIARGKFADGGFRAEEVLAKHDENYMPPEVAEKIKQQHNGTMPQVKP